MSQSPFQPDDELLSAYIDGELTEEELRAVEGWIESDSAARAMVEELRSVSSAVQALPRASVPAEWTAKLAERLDDARGNSSSNTKAHHESNGHGDAMPSLPFGRTSRGWWWSAAAIAAAVAIMFLMPRDPNELKVATNAPLLKAPASGGEMVMSAPEADNLPAMEPAPGMVAEAPASAPASADGEALEGERLNSLAVDAASPAPMATPESTPEASDLAGVATTPHAPAAATTLSARDALADSAPSADSIASADNAYLIVWCDVPPETLREREINNLLTGNGIVVDEKTDTWLAAAEPMRQQIELRNSGNYRSSEVGSLSASGASLPEASSSRFAVPDAGGGFASRERMERDSEEETADAPAPEALAIDERNDMKEPSLEGETILVEATADQIAGCLAAMQQDPSNFKSITIEPVSEQAIAKQLTLQRSLAAPAIAQTESQAAQGFAGLSRQAARDEQQGEQAGERQQLATQAERAQARRLARPEDWFFYNAAPKESQQGYRLPMLDSKTSKSATKSEYAYGDGERKKQLAELNRFVAQQPQQQVAGRMMQAPLVEQQPVQVLFVLRNSLLPDPVAASAESATGTLIENPPVEAAESP